MQRSKEKEEAKQLYIIEETRYIFKRRKRKTREIKKPFFLFSGKKAFLGLKTYKARYKNTANSLRVASLFTRNEPSS